MAAGKINGEYERERDDGQQQRFLAQFNKAGQVLLFITETLRIYSSTYCIQYIPAIGRHFYLKRLALHYTCYSNAHTA